MAYFSEEYLRRTAGYREYGLLNEELRKTASTSARGRELAKALSFAESESKRFDIFLSHSYLDKDIVWALKKEFERIGYSTYVDWVEDYGLDRTNVNKETAEHIRNRMKSCELLFYATSTNSNSSKWMPWECGFFDGYKGKVAICPIVKTAKDSFRGTEYLSLYNTVDFNKVANTDKDELWIYETPVKYVIASGWIKGTAPFEHKK
jgi:hypothetical protein